MCACFTDWQKAFDCLNWAKLMQILKNTGSDWCERCISANCMWIRVLLKDWAKNTQGIWRMEEELVKDAVCHHLFNLYNEGLTKKALEGFGDFKIGHVICTVKYADGLVLLGKEETILQGMTDGLSQDGRHYEMEMNVENTKVMRISREPCPVQIMTDQKQLGNM